MIRTLIEARAIVALVVATGVGASGLHLYPVRTDNVFLALIELRAPHVFQVIAYGYAALWFSTPYLVTSLVTSLLAIAVNRSVSSERLRPLPPYPQPEKRPQLSLVLGETHLATELRRAPQPRWLTIPERGLYAGVLVIGATGSGKTSACMYPFLDQILRWRADDPAHKIGGLVMEAKGDFCRDVRTMLVQAGRESDYVELSLDGDVCYNPLHSDLDPYTVAYAIASLANNLFGRSKEPFWQQAYVDLLRYIILLRRLADGYTTLADVYRYCLDDAQIDRDLRELKRTVAEPSEAIVLPATEHALHCAQGPWTRWYPADESTVAHPYSAELEGFLASRQLPYRVQRAHTGGLRDRQHQVDAIDRWFYRSWTRLDPRLRSSIVEGIVVLLGWFDAQPDLYRMFCPPRSAYTTPAPGEPRPVPPLADLFESGRVLGLNFPVAINPALARMLAILLKLDGFQTVLRRIPAIRANPTRVWRHILWGCDEYQTIASVGETQPTGDERSLALSRQARLIPIVSVPSLSALRAALPGEESCRALTSCFRTTIALAANDEFTARTLAERCGRRDRLKPRYTVSEASQDVHVSCLTARPTAERQTLTASKTYTFESDFIFQPRAFTELPTAVSVVVPFDGDKQLPPQYCYLKPHHLDVQTSYFDQVAQGAL